jgi:Tol biopolymer transport system component
VQDLKSGERLIASDAESEPANGPASDPAISTDGGFVTFSSSATNLPNGGGSGIYLRDLAARKTTRVSTGKRMTLDPVVARGGTAVAFTVVVDGGSRIAVWHADTNTTEWASVQTGSSGQLANGRSDDATISDDGTRIAFTSTATNLVPGQSSGVKAVYVRDLVAKTTTLVSEPEKAYEVGS